MKYIIIAIMFVLLNIMYDDIQALRKQVNNYNNTVIELQYKYNELQKQINKLYLR